MEPETRWLLLQKDNEYSYCSTRVYKLYFLLVIFVPFYLIYKHFQDGLLGELPWTILLGFAPIILFELDLLALGLLMWLFFILWIIYYGLYRHILILENLKKKGWKVIDDSNAYTLDEAKKIWEERLEEGKKIWEKRLEGKENFNSKTSNYKPQNIMEDELGQKVKLDATISNHKSAPSGPPVNGYDLIKVLGLFSLSIALLMLLIVALSYLWSLI